MPHPPIELWMMSLFASLVGTSEFLDGAVHLLLTNDLLKGVPFGTALLLLWAVPREAHAEKERTSLLSILLATGFSLVIGRTIQNLIVNPRPLMVPEMAVLYPPTFQNYRLDWNTFPSDHMALYFTIALGVYSLRRALGIGLILWCLLGVGFARISAGYHYPLDILGGIAVASASLSLVRWLHGWLEPFLARFTRLATLYPGLAAAAMFIICFQISTVFDTVRGLGEFGRVGMRLMLTALLQ